MLTMTQIEKNHAAAGGYFFSTNTMRCFGTDAVYGPYKPNGDDSEIRIITHDSKAPSGQKYKVWEVIDGGRSILGIGDRFTRLAQAENWIKAGEPTLIKR